MDYLWFVLIGIGVVLGVLFFGAILREIAERVKNKRLKRILNNISDFILKYWDPLLP